MSDITRQKTIDYLYYLKTHYPKNLIIPEYIDFAISSLETDEAYQLEYESTTKNDLGVDCILRAQAQTEIEMNASRYTIAKERGDMGQVEWSDQLIKVSDAVDVIRHLPSVTQEPRWIPVSERLPEDGKFVLFSDIDEDIMIGYHVKGRPNTHFTQDGTYEDMKNVRAWIPLPKAYKAESEE